MNRTRVATAIGLAIFALCAAFATVVVATDRAWPAAPMACDLSQYKASPGLTAVIEQDVLVVSWTGQAGAQLRARYGIESSQPIVRELAVRKGGGAWVTLGLDLRPE
jgi:hypothetical protein